MQEGSSQAISGLYQPWFIKKFHNIFRDISDTKVYNSK